MRFCRLVAAWLLLAALPIATVAQETTRVFIDFTNTAGRGSINRGVFALEGYPKVFRRALDEPRLMESYLRLNPMGTHIRMESWIGYLEPENDNDDPNTYDWSRMNPGKVIRFIEGEAQREAFEQSLEPLGVEPMPLVCYNTEWLASGDENDPVADKAEWAEFAAATVHSWNVGVDGEHADAPPRVGYIEIWNEPNMPMFYGGTRESFFELFNTAAERLHREFPYVQVGGPALTPAPWADPEGWYADFVEACGHHADFVIHHIYHGADRDGASYRDELIAKTDLFREKAGKPNGRMMITETDAWYSGWPKFGYLMDRHFRCLEIQDRLLGILHFTTLAYNESGGYTFGVMTEQGAPLGTRYWAFWLMRNLIGDRCLTTVREADAAAGARPLDAVASTQVNDAGQRLSSAVLHNPTEQTKRVEVTMYHHRSAVNRVVRVDSARMPEESSMHTLLNQGDFGLERLLPLDSGQTQTTLTLELKAFETVALTTIEPGERFFTFADLNDQEAPAVFIETQAFELREGDTFHVTVEMQNTTHKHLFGELGLAGLPSDWAVQPVGDHVLEGIGPGRGFAVMFEVTVGSTPPFRNRMALGHAAELGHHRHAVPIHATFQADPPTQAPHHGQQSAHSLPLDLIMAMPDDAAQQTGEGPTTGPAIGMDNDDAD